jgi:hypothetical protein
LTALVILSAAKNLIYGKVEFLLFVEDDKDLTVRDSHELPVRKRSFTSFRMTRFDIQDDKIRHSG